MRHFYAVAVLLCLSVATVLTSCSDDDGGGDIFQGARFLTEGDTLYLWKDETFLVSALFGIGTEPFLAGTQWTTGNSDIFTVMNPSRTMRRDSCIAYSTIKAGTKEGCAQLTVKFVSQYGHYKGQTRTLTLNVKNLDIERTNLDGLPEGSFVEQIGKIKFYMSAVEAGVYYHAGYRFGVEIDTSNWVSSWEKQYKDKMTYAEYRTRRMQPYLKPYFKYMDDAWIDDYYIGQTLVTAELWEAVMGNNPSVFAKIHKKRPIESVSTYNCKVFCERLSAMTGRKYRLPTNAEWEYAASGGKLTHDYRLPGTNDPFHDIIAGKGISTRIPDDTSYVVPIYKSAKSTYDVKQYLPNELGIYDMYGNVSEWVADTVLHEYISLYSINYHSFSFTDTIPSFMYRNINGEYRDWPNAIKYVPAMDTTSTYSGTTFKKHIGDESIGFRIALSASDVK